MNIEASSEYVQFTSHGLATSLRGQATKATQKKTRAGDMEKLLTCSVCRKLYNDPRVLPCQHSFCQDCLRLSPVESLEDKPVLYCPTCNKPAQLPYGGVLFLPKAFAINGFLELHQGMVNKKEEVPCKKHKRPPEAFCNSCQGVVCLVCAPHNHKKHDYATIPDCIHACTQQLEDGIQPLKNQVSTLMVALQKLNNGSEDCSIAENVVEQQIRQHAQDLRQAIDNAERKLVEQVKIVIRRKKEVINHQKKEAKLELGQLQLSIHLAREAHRAYADHQIVFSTQRILGLMEESRIHAESLKLAPAESADVLFEENLRLLDSCVSLGELRYTYLHERYSYFLDRLESMSELSIQEDNGTPVPLSPSLISCELLSSTESLHAACAVKEADVGKYEIDYSPVIRGSHHLKVQICGSDVPGSPFPVPDLPSCPESRDQPLYTLQDLTGPSDVAVTGTGQVVVTEDSRHRVTVFSPHLEKLRSVGSKGSSSTQFYFPKGVAVTNDHRIFIADTENHRIQVLTPDGKFLMSVGSQTDDLVPFGAPMGVAVHPSGRILVTDYTLHCVSVLSSDFTSSHMFGTYGTRRGELNHPCGVAVDSHGVIYVADCVNNRVQRFSIAGEHLSDFDSKGLLKGHLKKPFGIAIDANDCVYVNEAQGDSIHIFTSSGSLIRTFKPKDRVLQQPKGMAVDAHGNLFVCDHSRNCVVIF